MLSTIFNCLWYTLKKKLETLWSQDAFCMVGLPRWLSGSESVCQCRRCRFDAWVRKIPWSRKWQPTLVLLPGKSQGQRSLVGYRPWDSKELDLTDPLSMHTHTCMAIWTPYCFGWCLLELSVQSAVLPWTPPSCLLPLPWLTELLLHVTKEPK